MSESTIAFWKCPSGFCDGAFTPIGSRDAGKCLRCHEPMPDYARAGYAVDPRTSGLARGTPCA